MHNPTPTAAFLLFKTSSYVCSLLRVLQDALTQTHLRVSVTPLSWHLSPERILRPLWVSKNVLSSKSNQFAADTRTGNNISKNRTNSSSANQCFSLPVNALFVSVFYIFLSSLLPSSLYNFLFPYPLCSTLNPSRTFVPPNTKELFSKNSRRPSYRNSGRLL